jgi:hypothetical protein
MGDLRRMLARVPEAAPVQDIEAAVADSVTFLGSDAAQRSIDGDVYWPKWDAPWWHMVLLHELGEARRIPDRVVDKMIAGLNALPVKIFPFRPEDAPGLNILRDVPCHCALGSMYQVLAACGVDVDGQLPWVKRWLLRYQMADGGLSCDPSAYLVEHECPSSMVGTVAAFEAMLLGRWTDEQRRFAERAAGFLIGRELRLGSPTVHNAEERGAAPSWLLPCFPRFYLYDVLRGLTALVRWAELSEAVIPRRGVATVIEHLVTAFPDGVVRGGRQSSASCPMTWRKGDDGAWQRLPTERPALLNATCIVGAPSAALTHQWSVTRRVLGELFDAGRIVG